MKVAELMETGPGGRLGDGEHVEHLLVADPLVGFHRLPVDEGDHRVAAPEGEEADLEEGGEQS